MRFRHLSTLVGIVLVAASCADSISPAPGPGGPADTGGVHADTIYDVRVVATYPHSTESFTQGLIWVDTALVEGTGTYRGASWLRRVDLTTGNALQERTTPVPVFGEGVTQVGNRIVQLTWTEGVAFVYDAARFDSLHTFTYPTQGWGLTHDGARFIMSDGSETLYFRDLTTFQETGRVAVKSAGVAVTHLNELEYIDGLVYANIYQSDWIVIIDPADGRVVGRIDGEPLRVLAGIPLNDSSRVLNGIAWDAAGKRLLVTGKLWPKLFHIELEARE